MDRRRPFVRLALCLWVLFCAPLAGGLTLAPLGLSVRAQAEAFAPPPFGVHAKVVPSPVPLGAVAALVARTRPGAVCGAAIVYATVHHGAQRVFPFGPHDGRRRVPPSGEVRFAWRVLSSAYYGIALVVCSSGGQSAQAAAPFAIRWGPSASR